VGISSNNNNVGNSINNNSNYNENEIISKKNFIINFKNELDSLIEKIDEFNNEN